MNEVTSSDVEDNKSSDKDAARKSVSRELANLKMESPAAACGLRSRRSTQIMGSSAAVAVITPLRQLKSKGRRSIEGKFITSCIETGMKNHILTKVQDEANKRISQIGLAVPEEIGYKHTYIQTSLILEFLDEITEYIYFLVSQKMHVQCTLKHYVFLQL